MNKAYVFVGAVVAAVSVYANVWDPVLLKGRTDKANPVDYKRGEPIVFTICSENIAADAVPAGSKIKWTRKGDDGKYEEGSAPFKAGDTLSITTKSDIAGFVRIEATVQDANGRNVQRDVRAPGAPDWAPSKEVFFDGGAGIDVANIEQEVPEPADFDAYWTKQKAELAKVPVRADRKLVKTVNKCCIYAVSVDCAGPRPVTGYLFIPEGAAAKSCKARLGLQGYGFYKQGCPEWASWGCVGNKEIFFEINAHGYELDREPEYYKEFEKGIRPNNQGYAFSPEENANPDTAYFHGMVWRVLRALQYLKTLPEWNGKDLIAEGGSQGGLQTSWAAGLDPDVTLARPSITWGCDFAMTSGARKRLKGNWYIPYAKGLDYYDSINHIKRAKCPVEITRAGLGDYTCPPSGLAAYFNAIKSPKSIRWVQGSRHGFVPTEPNQIFTVKCGHEQSGEESKSQSASADVKN